MDRSWYWAGFATGGFEEIQSGHGSDFVLAVLGGFLWHHSFDLTQQPGNLSQVELSIFNLSIVPFLHCHFISGLLGEDDIH
jgi:hypothetical protein